ncbi:hypothetical protein [Spirillospora sp. NPDC048819]|uniref:hypothetical protein n=1 Tax=Spirillospora sp. NPDC048819 TaxID=3155268 RepID=UPI0033FF80E6
MRSYFEQAQETSRYLVAEKLIERLTLNGGHLAEIRMRRGVTVDMMVGYGCLR